MIDTILHFATIFGLIALRVYWLQAEQQSNRRLPSTTTRRRRFIHILHMIEITFYFVLVIQLMGVRVATFEPNWLTRILGVAMFGSGAALSLSGRFALHDNWSHMLDYQVKEQQQLVTDDIFKYVRHPIYGGVLLLFTGVEVIVASWLAIPLFIGLFLLFYSQSKKEEFVLARHFGKEYLRYVHRTKMFFPYIF
jgi:protein-S-isoprenylcysteine O-methyltransferase Ste14